MSEAKDLGLFVNRDHSGYTIVDHGGRTYTPARARAAWEAGRVVGYNLAFLRLATRCDFDVDRLREYDDNRRRPDGATAEGAR